MLEIEQGRGKRIVITPTAPTRPRQTSSAGSARPAARQPAPAPQIISEHGEGGGSSSSDTGAKPTAREIQTGYVKPVATQPKPAAAPQEISEHGQGGGSSSSDTGKKPTTKETQSGYTTRTESTAPPQVTSEHGEGGGSGSSGTGATPTEKQLGTGYTASSTTRPSVTTVISEHGQGAGFRADDTGAKSNVGTNRAGIGSSAAPQVMQVGERTLLGVEPVPPSLKPPISTPKQTAGGIAAAVARLPKWMLNGSSPPAAATKTGTLPRALTVAANPGWHTSSGREHFAFTYLKQTLRLNARATAALVGNMSIESRSPRGRNLTPGIWQSGSPPSTHTFTDPNTGYGIAQWTYPARKEALLSFAGKLPVANFGVELAYVAHELSHPATSPLIQPDTLAKLRGADSIQEATAIAMAAYEHPNTYKQVPAYPSVVHLLGEWHQGAPTGPNPSDASGYYARLMEAERIAKLYG